MDTEIFFKHVAFESTDFNFLNKVIIISIYYFENATKKKTKVAWPLSILMLVHIM